MLKFLPKQSELAHADYAYLLKAGFLASSQRRKRM